MCACARACGGTALGGGMADMCLMPPSVKREVHFLVLSIFAAEGLPALDDRELGGLVKAGIDAFVVVKVRTVHARDESVRACTHA